jgi:hypothetical protein
VRHVGTVGIQKKERNGSSKSSGAQKNLAYEKTVLLDDFDFWYS